MNKTLNFLGLLYRGNKLVLGEAAVNELNNNKLCLLIIANDISENGLSGLKKDYVNKAIRYSSKSELGNALGKNQVGIIGIKDPKIATNILDKIKEDI